VNIKFKISISSRYKFPSSPTKLAEPHFASSHKICFETRPCPVIRSTDYHVDSLDLTEFDGFDSFEGFITITKATNRKHTHMLKPWFQTLSWRNLQDLFEHVMVSFSNWNIPMFQPQDYIQQCQKNLHNPFKQNKNTKKGVFFYKIPWNY